jgi:TrmH family RNA methyltransferase
MLSKNRLKYLSSLSKKKFRQIEKKFIVEGVRTVEDGLKSDYVCEEVFVLDTKIESLKRQLETAEKKKINITEVTENELSRFTSTKHPQSIASIFRIKENTRSIGENVVALDNISDPGNLGTIIRTCDWFGVDTVLLGENCVEVFNPKVVRSTMGSIFHVNFVQTQNLFSELQQLKTSEYLLAAAHLDGNSPQNLPQDKSRKVLILGSEAFGPSENILKLADLKIRIEGNGKAESLNVSVAGGILIYEMFGKK